jgi:pyridoxal phosphate enzyme (YggS family)
MSVVRENLLRVMERIERAAQRAGRNPKEIKLVAVSKTVETDRIREAIDAGACIFGENYVQEAQAKIEALGRRVAWHFIGHLQSNKAKFAIRLFDMVHSVDSLSLAEELNRRAETAGQTLGVLIEVKLSEEATKFGTEEEGVFRLAGRIKDLSHLSLKGLMTMPPFFDSPEMSRPYFVRLRLLKDRMMGSGLPVADLSMGMSADFEIAIEEGATYVRIGTAIFGPRR